MNRADCRAGEVRGGMSGRRLRLNTGAPSSNSEGGPAAVIAILAILSLYAPQCHYYGRGISMACVLFAVWCLLILIRPTFARVWRHFEGRFFLLILFLLIVLFTYKFRGGDETCKQYIYGTIASIVAFSISAYYAASGTNALSHVLRWAVLLLGLAVLPSLPVVYDEPGIVRPLATGDETFVRYDAAVMGSGVGSYPLYTAIAVVWPSWIGLLSGARLPCKLALSAALILLAAAVALSTFTMARRLVVDRNLRIRNHDSVFNALSASLAHRRRICRSPLGLADMLGPPLRRVGSCSIRVR